MSLPGISIKDRSFLGAPDSRTMIRNGDTPIMCGRAETLSRLEKRQCTKGNRDPSQIIKEQMKVQDHEKQEDPEDQPCVKITHT